MKYKLDSSDPKLRPLIKNLIAAGVDPKRTEMDILDWQTGADRHRMDAMFTLMHQYRVNHPDARSYVHKYNALVTALNSAFDDDEAKRISSELRKLSEEHKKAQRQWAEENYVTPETVDIPNERDTMASQQLEHFTKKGAPKAHLVNLYKALRGIANVDDEGHFVALYKGTKEDPFRGQNTLQLRNAVKDRYILRDTKNKMVVIPRKIDPYYKEYIAALNQFLGDEHKDMRRPLGRIMSLRGLKNIAKSTNKDAALARVREYLDDLGYSVTYKTAYDSMNQVSDALRQHREQQAELERQRMERQALENRREAERRGMTPEELEAALEAERIAPFEYSNDVRSIVDNTDWTLASSKDDLIERGEDMHHCVGSYGEQVYNHKCLILMKGDETAEIRTDVDSNGIIKEASINQVKGPHNDIRRPDAELNTIAKSLVGKSVNDVEEDTSQVEQEICDIFCKQLIKPSFEVRRY